MDEPVLAWYFASTDRRTLHGDSKLRPGRTEVFEGELVLGHRGLHASRDPIDALIHGHGPIACRVELSGERMEGETQLCAAQRTLLWLADASGLLRERAREALGTRVDADLRDEAALRRLLESAREDVEERFDRLRDGEWKKHERGEDVDLEALRDDVEAARVRARLLDAAVRLCSDRFEALRSVYEDLRDAELTLDLTSTLDALPKLSREEAPSETHPLDPMDVRKGPLHHARDQLGRELGKIRWITRAGYGMRHPDGAHVLLIETKATKKLKPRRDARLVVERIRSLLAMDELLVVLDRAHWFRFDLRAPGLFTDGSERTHGDADMLEQLGELSLVRVSVPITTHETRPSTWQARLKDGPAIRTSGAPLDRLHFYNMPSFTPTPRAKSTLRRKSVKSESKVDPGRYARGFIGEPIREPREPTRGVSVWNGMTYQEACRHARAVLPALDDPRPAVVIDGIARPAARVHRMPPLATLRDAATRIICGSACWSHETEVEVAVRKLGRTATYPTFAVEQPVPLEDEALSVLLRAKRWILAAWLVSIAGCGGCVGIEIWRTHPNVDPIADAMRIAQMWHELAGPARMVVVFREASPARWVFVGQKGLATEIYPIGLLSRSLCYLAG